MSGSRQEERLREILRLGDPAGDGHEPDAGETARMRASIVDAATGPDRRMALPWAWAGGLAAAAAGAIAIAVFLGGRPQPSPEPVPQVPGPRVVAQAPEVPETVPAPPLAADVPSVAGPPLPEPAPPAVVAVLPPKAEARPARQVHFIGARGTRIIWKLDPDFDL